MPISRSVVITHLPDTAVVQLETDLSKTGVLNFLLDTGASMNVIRMESLHEGVVVKGGETVLTGIGGEYRTLGMCTGRIAKGSLCVSGSFCVVKGQHSLGNFDGILGRPFLKGRAILDWQKGILHLMQDQIMSANGEECPEKEHVYDTEGLNDGVSGWMRHNKKTVTKLNEMNEENNAGDNMYNEEEMNENEDVYSKKGMHEYERVNAYTNEKKDNGQEDKVNDRSEVSEFEWKLPQINNNVSNVTTCEKEKDDLEIIEDVEGNVLSVYDVGKADMHEEYMFKIGDGDLWTQMVGQTWLGVQQDKVEEQLKLGIPANKEEIRIELEDRRKARKIQWGESWKRALVVTKSLHKNFLEQVYSETREPMNDETWLTEHQSACVNNPEDRENKLLSSLQLDDEVSEKDKEKVKSICMEFQDVFHLPGDVLTHTNLRKFTIPLKEDAGVINKKQYRMAQAHREAALKQIKELLKDDLIEPSASPFNSPVLMVPKKGIDEDGKPKMRMCVDFRELNKHIIPYNFPLPHIDDTIQQLGKAKWFTTLDLANGYHQVEIEPRDREKTAFSVGGYHYAYKRMPFGISSAPGFFQGLITSMLHNLKESQIFAYIDDIIIASETVDEHFKKLRAVFDRLREYNLKLGVAKCRFLSRQIIYLGHMCTPEGIKPNPELVKAVQEFPQPTSVKEVQSFLGLANYYRKFIKNYAEIALPLIGLTRKSVKFEFDEKCIVAFKELKEALATKVVLRYPEWDKEFRVSVDASGYALGAVLEQEGRPVAYGSRVLNQAERKYCTTDRELLAVVWATKLWRAYLLGRHFKVISDHRPLQGTVRVKEASARVLRFHQKLSEYDFTILYKKGKDHTNADTLSRIPIENGQIHAVTRSVSARQKPEVVGEKENKQSTKTGEIDQEHSGGIQDKGGTTVINDDPLPPVTSIEFDLKQKKSTDIISEEIENITDKRRIESILQDHHDSLFGGHYGIEKTLQKIQRRFRWPYMRRDVTNYVKSCDTCQRIKIGKKPKAPLVISNLSDKPFDKLYFDIVGPLPPSGEEGYKYILSMCDCLSRFVVFRPMKDQTAETVAQAMFEEVICKFVIPKVIVTDNGANFVSKLIKGICKMLEVQQINTTPYHPQSNLVERQHQSLANYLRAFVDKFPRSWHTLLPSAAYAHNITENRTTGMAPMELVFGFKPEMPSKLNNQRYKDRSPTYDDYKSQLRNRLQMAWQEAKERAIKEKAIAKRYYDRNVREEEYHIGDWVLLHLENRPNKLCGKYEGPFEVVMVHDNHNITIVVKGKLKRVHVNRVKKYYERDKLEI